MFLFFQHFNTSAAAASSALTNPPPPIHTPTFRGAVCPGPFLLVGTHEQSRRHFTPRTTRLPLQYVHSKSKPNTLACSPIPPHPIPVPLCALHPAVRASRFPPRLILARSISPGDRDHRRERGLGNHDSRWDGAERLGRYREPAHSRSLDH